MSKKEMDVIQAVRIQSLWHASRTPDKQESDYVYRVMARFFSEKWGYKLHEVDDLPVEFVAQNYYEAQYEELTPEEREEEIKYLTRTEEETTQAQTADEEFLKHVVKEAEANAKTKANQLDVLREAGKKIDLVGKEIKKTVADIKKELKNPEIEMKFVSPEDMESMSEWDILGKPPE